MKLNTFNIIVRTLKSIIIARNVLTLTVILVIITGCFGDPKESDFTEYHKLNSEKQKLSFQYYKLVQEPKKNESALRNLDIKIYNINDKIKKLSSKPHIQEYMQEQARINFERITSRTNTPEEPESDDNNEEFEYQVDNINVINDEFDFSNREPLDPSEEKYIKDYDPELDGDHIIMDQELIDVNEGFLDTEFDISVDERMEESEEPLDSELDFEEDDIK